MVAEDGVERELDAIISSARASTWRTCPPAARLCQGRDGRTRCRRSGRAALAARVPRHGGWRGFPNLFMLLGPNTGLGRSSMVYMIESQIAHVMAALRAMGEEKAETVEVAPWGRQAFNEEVDRRHEATVWNSGCSSWYLDYTGRNATLWPDWTFLFRPAGRRRLPSRTTGWRRLKRVLLTGAASGIGEATAAELRPPGRAGSRARPRQRARGIIALRRHRPGLRRPCGGRGRRGPGRRSTWWSTAQASASRRARALRPDEGAPSGDRRQPDGPLARDCGRSAVRCWRAGAAWSTWPRAWRSSRAPSPPPTR